MLKSLRRINSNLVSDAKNHMSSWFVSLCPYDKNHKDIRSNHKEKSIRRNHKGCIVYQDAKTIGKVTSLKHMSLCIVSLLMVEVYVLMVFLHKEGASPLG